MQSTGERATPHMFGSPLTTLPPQFFTGRKLHPAGIGIEAPETWVAWIRVCHFNNLLPIAYCYVNNLRVGKNRSENQHIDVEMDSLSFVQIASMLAFLVSDIICVILKLKFEKSCCCVESIASLFFTHAGRHLCSKHGPLRSGT